MISGLKIGNFKAFGPAQEIPLRPLTLIFGPNSAGKSSIIQSLLLARHIQDTGNVDAHQTTLGGAAVDLGGFGRFVHGRIVTREATIQFSIPRSQLRGRFHDLDGFETLTMAYEIGVHGASIAITSIALFLDGNETRRIVPFGAGTFAIEKAPIELANPLAFHDYATGMQKIVAELHASEGPKALEQWSQMFGAPDRMELVEELSAARFKLNGLALGITNPLPPKAFYTTDDLGPEEHSADSNPREFFAHVSELGEDELHHGQAMYRWFETDNLSREERDAAFHPHETPTSRAKAIRFAVECVIEAANEAIANGLAVIDYLGPLRWIPPRFIPDGEQFDASWMAGGGDDWQRLRREPKLLSRVNHFLQEVLRSRYRLECQRFALVESSDGSTRESPPDLQSARVAEETASPTAQRTRRDDETITTLSIVDSDSGLRVSHRDVGTGISQLLPVLVNAAGSEERLIMIEQPELHLHPALQAELGDVFIESALGENKNTFLIETHSEHLILRLLRRIRESNAHRQPKNLPELKPEDVAILFVEPTDSGSIVKHLRVDERGRLIDEWPGGFFEESFDEMF
ncbi:MAG: DUF3696 domain-containing protein [Chthoniobacteraceae bacterium]